MECPFCGEDGFDLVGLKIHLTGEQMLFAGPCDKFIELDTNPKRSADSEDV